MARKKRELRAVGVNIFAGGFTVGVSKHFEVLAHLEHDDYGAEIVERNFPHLPVYTSKEDWHEFRPGDVDFIFANPPCAVWSAAGVNKGEEWRDDPRLGRIKDIFSLLDKWRPRVWAWESVTGACGRGWPFVKSLIKRAARIGYSATVVFINAKWHGVPQTRRRFFLVLHDVEIPWHLPSYKEGPSAWETIKGITPNVHMKPFNKTYLSVVRRMKPGDGYNTVFDRVVPPHARKKNARGQVVGRGAFLTHRMPLEGPASTVVGAQMIHPKEHRMLSVNELAALCGFPVNYNWGEKLGRAPGYISRGVCPPVGEWLARCVADGIRADKRLKQPKAFIADLKNAPGVVAEYDLETKRPKKEKT